MYQVGFDKMNSAFGIWMHLRDRYRLEGSFWGYLGSPAELTDDRCGWNVTDTQLNRLEALFSPHALTFVKAILCQKKSQRKHNAND